MSTVTAGQINAIFGRSVEFPTANLLVVTKEVMEMARNRATPKTLAKTGLSFFRHTNTGDIVLTRTPTNKLEPEDLQFLAANCDGQKKSANDRVKRILVDAIEHGVDGKPFHLFDIGCGTAPIINKMSRDANVVFTGIDAVKKPMDIVPHFRAAATNADAMPVALDQAASITVDKDRIPVATAAYSLHFFDKHQFLHEVDPILDTHGFFAGNLHLVGNRRQKEIQLTEMEDALDNTGLYYRCIVDGTNNNFFVVADDSQSRLVDNMADRIKRSVANSPIAKL